MKSALALLFLLPFAAFADPAAGPAPAAPAQSLRLPAILSDHMVLQAHSLDPVWGWAPPNSKITVRFEDDAGKILARNATSARADGRWFAHIIGLPPGKSGKLVIGDGAETKEIHDVVTGEVWLCGGQSNMEFQMNGVLDAKQEIANSSDPGLRLFHVPHRPALKEYDDVPGGYWAVSSPESVRYFSAVGYYFGKHLRSSLHEPVGLIGSYWGGTTAQVWTSQDGLGRIDALQKFVAQFDHAAGTYGGDDAKYQADVSAFPKKLDAWNRASSQDKSYQDSLAAWRDASAKATQAHKPAPPMPQPPTPRPVEPAGGGENVASMLYNGMIAPLVHYGLRGAIWFQADGNLGDVPEYGTLIKALIEDWRAHWNRPLPFYYVEMNNMRDYPQTKPVQYNALCVLREQQQAALELPNTGVVCSIDVGLRVPEPHFPNKKPVGDRLAALALNNDYGQKGLVNSPAYKSFQVEGNKIRLTFTDAAGLRLMPGHTFAGFAIKGATGDWVWAQGDIEGENIVAWNDAVPKPVAVRYAWAANPVVSIQNEAGLPMRPFRTDTGSPQ